MMKLASLIVAALFAAASLTAVAQEKKTDKKATTAEQSTKKDKPKREMTDAQKARNKECAAQANEKKLKGDERKKFMSSCVKPAKPAATKTDKPKTEKKS
jgi:uncharacterized protein HemX